MVTAVSDPLTIKAPALPDVAVHPVTVVSVMLTELSIWLLLSKIAAPLLDVVLPLMYTVFRVSDAVPL
jgi:hypothetical protein